MPFEWALQQMREGKSVRRLAWETNMGWSRFKQNMWIESVNEDVHVLRFLFSDTLTGDDLLANDWMEHFKEQ